MRADSHGGFTLIELVVAISISAVLVGFLATFMTTPMEAYFAQSRRALLVHSADTALRMIAADVHTALPNSVRPINNGGVVGMELLGTTDMVDYRDTQGTPDARGVDFSTADQNFSTMGTFRSLVIPTGSYLSIGNAGVAGKDAYEVANGTPAHVITSAGTTIVATADASNVAEDKVSLSSAVTFSSPSAGNHVFVVSGPIAYLCDSGAQTLTRFSGYSISTTTGGYTAGMLLANGATAALVARNVASCQIDIVAPGPIPQGQLVVLRLLLSLNGDNLPLMQETPVDNIS